MILKVFERKKRKSAGGCKNSLKDIHFGSRMVVVSTFTHFHQHALSWHTYSWEWIVGNPRMEILGIIAREIEENLPAGSKIFKSDMQTELVSSYLKRKIIFSNVKRISMWLPIQWLNTKFSGILFYGERSQDEEISQDSFHRRKGQQRVVCLAHYRGLVHTPISCLFWTEMPTTWGRGGGWIWAQNSLCKKFRGFQFLPGNERKTEGEMNTSEDIKTTSVLGTDKLRLPHRFKAQ